MPRIALAIGILLSVLTGAARTAAQDTTPVPTCTQVENGQGLIVREDGQLSSECVLPAGTPVATPTATGFWTEVGNDDPYCRENCDGYTKADIYNEEGPTTATLYIDLTRVCNGTFKFPVGTRATLDYREEIEVMHEDDEFTGHCLVVVWAQPQSATPAATPIAETNYISDEDLAVIRDEFVPLCDQSGCSIQDFYPFVFEDGTWSTEAATFWPRENCAAFEADPTVIVLVPTDDVTMRQYYGEASPTTCMAVVAKPNALTIDNLKNNRPVPPAPQCASTTCRNNEFFYYSNPPASRMAFGSHNTPYQIEASDDMLVLVWRNGRLESHYGPDTVEVTPNTAWWYVEMVG